MICILKNLMGKISNKHEEMKILDETYKKTKREISEGENKSMKKLIFLSYQQTGHKREQNQ